MARASLLVLSEGQIEKIADAALHLLSDVGISVPSPEARDLFAAAGARCKAERVMIPPEIVREKLATVPSSFRVCGRSGEAAVTVGEERTHIQPMVGRLNILDWDGVRRKTDLRDVGRIVRICDGLSRYDVLHGGAVMPHIEGVPDSFAPVAGFVQTLRNTGKPFKGTCRGSEAARRYLTLPRETSEGALEYIRAGWPVDFASEPQMGATSPVTLASTTAQAMAECLSGVVLAQTANLGAPVLAGTVGAAMDMRHATIALGGSRARSSMPRTRGWPVTSASHRAGQGPTRTRRTWSSRPASKR